MSNAAFNWFLINCFVFLFFIINFLFYFIGKGQRHLDFTFSDIKTRLSGLETISRFDLMWVKEWLLTGESINSNMF